MGMEEHLRTFIGKNIEVAVSLAGPLAFEKGRVESVMAGILHLKILGCTRDRYYAITHILYIEPVKE